ncbi:hypothetical protein [Aeromonas salmonicida]|uniref:hypothetical protein n=1 Tax=Aeromonas salmonicida TaxID=645 RepID=UPI0011193BD8|nr:hypothetical protein [Aeromonas salmonicida]
MKRFTHDADFLLLVVLRSLGFQLVPFKLHRFRKQRHSEQLFSLQRKREHISGNLSLTFGVSAKTVKGTHPLGSACSMEINNWSHHINAARIIPLFVKNNSWRRLSIGIVIENK